MKNNNLKPIRVEIPEPTKSKLLQDANKIQKGWSCPDFDDSNWKPVIPCDISVNLLQPRKSVPVRIIEKITPIEIITTPQRDTLLDFGQNMVGWVEFKISNPKIKIVRERSIKAKRSRQLCCHLLAFLLGNELAKLG